MYDKIDPESGKVTPAPACKLTDAQAEVIDRVYTQCGLELTFVPLEMYPCRSNKDSARRRTITTLVKKGLVEKVLCGSDRPCIIEGGKTYRLRLTYAALDAFTEYAKKCNYQFPWD